MCPRRPRGCPVRLEPLTRTTLLAQSKLKFRRSTTTLTPLQAQPSHSNPIARQFQDGFLQTAVSKAPRRGRLARHRQTLPPGRSRYSTKVLGDLRCGSITSTTGRCGKPTCHCHQRNDPGHGPNLRLTYKVAGKTATESLPDQAATRKAEREIAEFRKLQALHKEFVEVNAQICQLRPPEPDALSSQEKKRPKRSSRKSRAK